jgi:hypothetical protein
MNTIKTGKYKNADLIDAIGDMYTNDIDYLLFLEASGTLKLGHSNCDYAVIDAVGNFETLHSELVQDFGRFCSVDDFRVCFGKVAVGKTLDEAWPDYYNLCFENHAVVNKRP